MTRDVAIERLCGVEEGNYLTSLSLAMHKYVYKFEISYRSLCRTYITALSGCD
jgi:hypothetical protein